MSSSSMPPVTRAGVDRIQAEFVVIGAGFAGVSTALALARRASGRKVILLEKESAAGTHSSGRNAGMVRQVTSEETISDLARRGADYIRSAASALFRPTGSLLLAAGPKLSQLDADIASARAGRLQVEKLDPDAARARYPVLRDAKFEIAGYSPTDGVVDLAGLVAHYLEAARAAGAGVFLGRRVLDVGRERRAWRIRAGELEVTAPVLVNAGGPWAADIGVMAGVPPLPLRPRRRHIFVTKPLDWVPPDWPFIWDISSEVYFRPEEGGLLFSPCDEGDPGDRDSDASDPVAREALCGKLERQFPRLCDLPVARSWSGLRTLSPDGRFVLGPDPAMDGFFWVAGLGGHGVTCSHAIGELAAELVLHPQKDSTNPHSPSRFRGRHDNRGA